ncbi:class I SAM-dependent methyltransferase [Paenibacillus thalictri]|uniref:Class I SAM-dependent methyltransferase n=1 Tax=Paenibacillus thalictri TaxID=2527873 RepID=A0A4Q9DMG8_9BACL|nr:class I SAM-dependent methyltransferase [Paenibacillus thalictri]TBL75289.1 class I SAM-dependent methyltransferase [Paenibacillus thalictri]
MHRFWEKVIRPIIIAAQPNVIVEIGSLTGLNTFKLLDYSKHCDAQCIVIEPMPRYDAELASLLYGKHVRFMKQFSLDALPDVERCDLMLIDGDHNWYTVYHELKLVENMAAKSGSFPIVLFHDTDWPYGRRDMYYFPESIPEQYRKPYAQKGMEPGRSELLAAGGFNVPANNALYENGAQNGVLTAIEDFMGETSFKLHFHKLHSNNGLGILVPDHSPIRKVLPYILATSGL